MPPADLFGIEGANVSRTYANLRTPRSDTTSNIRRYVEALWRTYEPYAEPDFVGQFSTNIAQRYWEMYLACSLLDLGFDLAPNRGKAARPDIKATKNNKVVWFEAIAPTPGNPGGADAVPERAGGFVVADVPVEQIIMRYTAAIAEKKRKYDEYEAKGVIGPDEACLIAVSGGAIWQSQSGVLPYILSAVLPIGDMYVTIPKRSGGVTDTGFHYRPAVTKKSGVEVSSDVFFQDDFRSISGVVFSEWSIGNSPDKLGSDLLTIHNPRTTRPFDRGAIERGIEYWVIEQETEFRLEKLNYEKA